MIRVDTVVCKKNFTSCKQKFEKDATYYSYIKDGSQVVFHNGIGILFPHRRYGHLRLGMGELYFQHHFEIIDSTYVQNRKELQQYHHKFSS